MSTAEATVDAARATLHELLSRGTGFDAEYGPSLSNHRPMALTALHRLGADASRLRAFAATYERRLHPMPPLETWPSGDAWAGRLGDPRAWPAYRHLFAQWLAHEGSDMLPQVLPRLLQGVGAAAFHGLLRTAYALDAGHAGELADALAYWACRWLDLGPAGTPGTTVATPATHATRATRASRATRAAITADPAAALKALDAARITTGTHDLIVHRMQAAAAARGFDAVVQGLRIDATATLPRLARLAARLYARSGNFTALHLVTSAHALRGVLARLEPEDAPSALAAYWRAYVAGVAAAGARLDRAPAALPWDALVDAALASDDDHLVKLVDAAREEQRHHGGADDWQRAATRAVLAARAVPGAA
jgi:hypothetical protein